MEKQYNSLDNIGQEQLIFYPRDNSGTEYSPEGTLTYGPLRYTNVQDLLAKFFTTAYQMVRMDNWRPLVIGIPSTILGPGDANAPPHTFTLDHQHMPMLDYDGRNVRPLVRRDIETLQGAFGLGPAWVYRTRRGFHVYFFCDALSFPELTDALSMTHCCKGFAQATLRRGTAALRVSAKYTDFDISLEKVMQPAHPYKVRPLRKAHVIQELLRLGASCGTHFASLFPRWAFYTEDPKPWRPPTKRSKRKEPAAVRILTEAEDIATKPWALTGFWSQGEPTTGWKESITVTSTTGWKGSINVGALTNGG